MKKTDRQINKRKCTQMKTGKKKQIPKNEERNWEFIYHLQGERDIGSLGKSNNV
jgi:hypothetical protein